MVLQYLLYMLVVLLSIDTNAASGAYANNALKSKDLGRGRNCGNSSTQIYITWKPPAPRVGDTLLVSLHYKAPATFNAGYLESSFYIPGIENPVYHKVDDFSCHSIKMFLSEIGGIRCPFIKGQIVSIRNYKLFIPPSLPIPTGTYGFKLKIREHFNGGLEYACLEGAIRMRDD